MLERLRNGRVSYKSGQFRIGGYPAVQYQLRGSVDKVKLVYFHTTVEGPNSFHQIVAWTLPSRLTKNEPVLQGVIRSLRVGGATSSHAFWEHLNLAYFGAAGVGKLPEISDSSGVFWTDIV